MPAVFISNIRRTVVLFLWLTLATAAFAQQNEEQARLAELRRMREQIELRGTLRDSDLMIVLSERILSQAAQQLVGLEIVLSNGSTIRVTSIESELRTAAAVVKIGLQARSSITVNLQLLGRINSGEIEKDTLRLPVQVTDVKLGNGLFSSMLIKTMLGEWLKPETWNDEMPALELPVELSEMVQFPARKFDVSGDMPAEISTPAFELPLKFSLVSFLVLQGRAVLILTNDPGQPAVIRTAYAGGGSNDVAALEREIETKMQAAPAGPDLQLRFGRGVISQFLERIAAAQTTDLEIRMKQGRLRTEQVDSIVRITNYTDIESGEGRADITQLAVDRITGGQIQLRLSGKGEMDTRLRGREYGIPYSVSPRVAFEIRQQIVPLEFAREADRAVLRALPGTTLPLQLRIMTNFAGQNLGFDRTMNLPAEKLFSAIELPAFFGRDIPIPSKMEIDAGGNLTTTARRMLKYTLSNLRLNLNGDVLDLAADVSMK